MNFLSLPQNFEKLGLHREIKIDIIVKYSSGIAQLVVAHDC